jgi:hypothetical protein
MQMSLKVLNSIDCTTNGKGQIPENEKCLNIAKLMNWNQKKWNGTLKFDLELEQTMKSSERGVP